MPLDGPSQHACCLVISCTPLSYNGRCGLLSQDCNLVLYSISQLQQSGATSAAALWGSNTYLAGTTPCSAVVSSAGGGSLSVLDATGVLLFLAPSGAAAPDPSILQHRFNALQTGALGVPSFAMQRRMHGRVV